jgi:hypothetical protein
VESRGRGYLIHGANAASAGRQPTYPYLPSGQAKKPATVGRNPHGSPRRLLKRPAADILLLLRRGGTAVSDPRRAGRQSLSSSRHLCLRVSLFSTVLALDLHGRIPAPRVRGGLWRGLNQDFASRPLPPFFDTEMIVQDFGGSLETPSREKLAQPRPSVSGKRS